MTINSEVRIAGPFQGNDVTVDFPFAFKVFGADEVLVVREEAGVELVLELSVDYTVALNADQEAAPGGVVTLLAGPLPSGETLTLTSALAPLQPVDLTNQGGFYPRVINGSLDRLTILTQQLSERLSRTLVAPISDGAGGFGDLPGVSARKGSVLAFDEVTGAPRVGPSVGAVGTVVANTAAINTVATSIGAVNTVAGNLADVTNFAGVYYGPSATDPLTRRDGSPLQEGDLYFNTSEDAMRTYDGARWVAVASGSIGSTTFSGDGVETEFLLPSSPGSKNNTQVYVNGVYQQKGGYELAGVGGALLVFNTPPPPGTNNIEVVTLAPLPVDPLTAEDITDLIALRGTAVRKDSSAASGAAILPNGTNAQRPSAPVEGMVRYNSDINDFEYYINGAWVSRTTLTRALNEAPIVTLASASTVNIGVAGANTISISGTTGITTFDTIASGSTRRLVFQGALTLTHNATSLILPGAANITTAAGDVAEFVSLGGGNWRCIGYQRASGTPLVAIFSKEFVSAEQSITFGGQLSLSHGLGVAPKLVTFELVCETAQLGYSVNDVVDYPSAAQVPLSGESIGISVDKTSTSTLVISIGTGGLLLAHKSTRAVGNITAANWRLVARAYA